MGVDADVDLYHTEDLDVDWSLFGPMQIEQSKFLLIAVSQAYRDRWFGRAPLGMGAGAAREAIALRRHFEKDQRDFNKRAKIVFLPGSSEADLPDDLGHLVRFKFDRLNSAGLETLVRHLVGDPAFPKPSLGPRRVLGPAPRPRVIEEDDSALANLTPRSTSETEDRFEPKSPLGEWEEVDPGPLVTRTEGAGAWTGDEIIVVGGLVVDQYRYISDGGAYNPRTRTWRKVPSVPGGGRIVDATWTGTEVVVIGNQYVSIPTDAVASVFAAYNPDANAWRALASPPRPIAAFPKLLNLGDQIVAWGPRGSGNPGFILNLQDNCWRTLPPPPAGVFRFGSATQTDGTIAATAVMLPPAGGPMQSAVAFLELSDQTWRLSDPAPPGMSTHMPIAWTGERLLIFQPDPVLPALVYEPLAGEWGTVASPTRGVTVGTMISEVVRLDDGRIVVRIADLDNPLQIWNSEEARWDPSGAPPGPTPATGSVFVSIGSGAFLYGIRTREDIGVETQQPNAAWLWRPRA